MRARHAKRGAVWCRTALAASLLTALALGACAPSRGTALTGPWGALSRHFAGGFGIYTTASAQSAAANGVTTAFVYGSADPATAAALRALGMPRVEALPWSLLLRYECFRLTQIERSWPVCQDRDVIPTEDELLRDVGAYLRGVQHDPRVVGYWILDDWPPFDSGAARAVLPAITRLVHQLTPGRPTICGFGTVFGPHYGPGDIPGLVANYSPGACDMVAPYLYSASVTDPTTSPSSFDWSMSSVLPRIESALRARGWDATRVPLIGVAQAWGGARTDVPGAYEIVPTAANLAEQSASYCRYGASGIVYYAWSDSTVANMQTPANNAQLALGVKQGVAACARAWAGGA